MTNRQQEDHLSSESMTEAKWHYLVVTMLVFVRMWMYGLAGRAILKKSWEQLLNQTL